MSTTVVTHPTTTALTSLRRVKVELGLDLTVTTQDERLDALIEEASAAIESYCGRSFARAEVKDAMPGTGRTRLVLARTPVRAITSVVYADSTLSATDYEIEDEEAGFLYREDGWYWTPGEDARALVPSYQPSWATNEYEVTYTGGYLLPGHNRSLATLSIATSTACVKDSASGLPLLVAGDRLTFSGWLTAANNQTVTVVSRTAAKVVVGSSTLVAEASTDLGTVRTVTCRNLPSDLERACLETVKAWYVMASRDPALTGKQVGDLSLTYAADAVGRALPLPAMRLLSAYRRIR